ncbi:MAG TPA: squalene/phytoene synthase family protein [Methylomirabilota bacterium]|nr:squalene/phytoene synthase family protein [Methylomirabilota bacterium]
MSDDLLRSLLRQVSRSFYLSLAILPAALREPIGLAYLLARAADSVADTRLLPRGDRLAHLETLRRAYSGEPADVAAVGLACAPHRRHPAEQRLLERVDGAVARLERLDPGDRDQVRQVLATLTAGMVFDLTRFGGEDASAIDALDTLDELDHYTYLIAGCVGPFWTALHVTHRPRLRHWGLWAMSARAVRFGKALQLTNILRDVPADLRSGRCYLPARELLGLGLLPRDLLDPVARGRARPLLHRLLGLALDHYEVGWQYTLAIPRLEWRMRLACAWPLMIGLATLRDLAAHPDPLGAPSPIKIGRREVRAILARSLIAVWSDAALGAEATRARQRVAV